MGSEDICCVCISQRADLQPLSCLNGTETSNYNKLTACVPEMCFKELHKEQHLICDECCDGLDFCYKFREKCLRSKSLFISYVTRQRLTVNTNETDTDVKNEDSKIEAIYIKSENLSDENEETTKEDYDMMFNMDYIEPEVGIEEDQGCEDKDDDGQNSLSVQKAGSSQENKSKNNSQENTNVPKSLTFLNKTMKDQFIQSTTKLSFQCEICLKRFAWRSTWNMHRRIHSGERPHECQECHVKFTRLPDLRRHQLTHSGHKPYECEDCHKRFTQLQNLKRHRLTHSGHKPFKCSQCPKRFYLQSRVKEHQALMHSADGYQCVKCNKKFAQKQTLKRHQIMHHE